MSTHRGIYNSSTKYGDHVERVATVADNVDEAVGRDRRKAERQEHKEGKEKG